VKEFCGVPDINEAMFYSWQKKYHFKGNDNENGLNWYLVINLSSLRDRQSEIAKRILFQGSI